MDVLSFLPALMVEGHSNIRNHMVIYLRAEMLLKGSSNICFFSFEVQQQTPNNDPSCCDYGFELVQVVKSLHSRYEEGTYVPSEVGFVNPGS